jgi:urocanate hydratase
MATPLQNRGPRRWCGPFLFIDAIARGELGTVILGRDHHDVSGTDSPYRETSNIYDGSRFTADMAVHNAIGDSFRGATWVSLHNGGGVGWGEVINGGFGLVLDGTEEADRKLETMLFFDVNNGIARRAWARNPEALKEWAKDNADQSHTLPVDWTELLRKEYEELFAELRANETLDRAGAGK